MFIAAVSTIAQKGGSNTNIHKQMKQKVCIKNRHSIVVQHYDVRKIRYNVVNLSDLKNKKTNVA